MARITMRPRLTICGRSWSSFHVCGLTGLLLGTTLALALAGHSGLSRLVVALLLACGVATFLLLAMVTKIVTGREALVYYHHEIAILSVCAALLAMLRLPVLAYLDVTALGLGVFLACGRCGCLLVGCCHGRPWRWGVRYGDAHAVEGFPRGYVGARLFPVQALEALVVTLIVVAGAVAIVFDQPPGTAWSLYIVSYSLARIWLEELRGDGVRPYWWRVSEAQWTSLVLILAVVVGGWQERLPPSTWHVGAAVAAMVSIAWVALRRSSTRALLQSRHVGEIAALVNRPPSARDAIAVHCTSQALAVSSEWLPDGECEGAMLCSISHADRTLTAGEARSLARLVGDLAAVSSRATQFVRGGHDVVHVIVPRASRRAPQG